MAQIKKMKSEKKIADIKNKKPNCYFIMHKQEFGEGHGTVNINYDCDY